ncbi:MAG: class I SAM-dependent methyltransferase [Bacillota bacterium]
MSSLFYSAVAGLYDTLAGRYIQSRLISGLSLLGDIAGQRVLDVGTGTGIVAASLAESGAIVTGVDLSEPMLRRARSKRIPGATFLRMDAKELAFPDASFHVSTISMVLHEMSPSDRKRILSEMIRVTQKSLLVIEFAARPSGVIIPLFLSLLEIGHSAYYRDFIRRGPISVISENGLVIARTLQSGLLGFYLCQPERR